MVTAFETTHRIALAPDAVWTVLTDWSRAHEWMPGIDALVPDGPTAVGTTLRFTAHGRDRTSTIAVLEPGARLMLHSEAPGVVADYTYTLVAAGEGETDVTLVADVVTKGAMRPLGPTIRSSIAKADSVQLERLAALLAA